MEMRVHGEVSYLILTFKHNKKKTCQSLWHFGNDVYTARD